jgi:hypothetical protein
MTTITASRQQLSLNDNGFESINVILNGKLLFCTKEPDVADIIDAYNIDASNGVTIMKNGIYEKDYIKSNIISTVVVEKSIKSPKKSTPVATISESALLKEINSSLFKTNSEQLLKDAGISMEIDETDDEDNEDIEYKSPNVGDKIYVPAVHGALSKLHGGFGIVEQVNNTSNGVYLLLVDIPNFLFLWSEIAEFQDAMAEEFKNVEAKYVSM